MMVNIYLLKTLQLKTLCQKRRDKGVWSKEINDDVFCYNESFSNSPWVLITLLISLLILPSILPQLLLLPSHQGTPRGASSTHSSWMIDPFTSVVAAPAPVLASSPVSSFPLSTQSQPILKGSAQIFSRKASLSVLGRPPVLPPAHRNLAHSLHLHCTKPYRILHCIQFIIRNSS